MREAVLSVSDDELAAIGIGELVAHCRAAGLSELQSLHCEGDGAEVLATVAEPLDPALLDALSYVEEWEPVVETDDERQYRIAFTAPEVSATAAERADDLVGDCDPELEADGARLSLVGPQSAIGATVAEYEDAGMSPDLRSLGSYDTGEAPLDELTERQREVIRTAWRLGYYEVPREAATEDVAGELDLDPSTVAEHLQRAERNLLGRVLADD